MAPKCSADPSPSLSTTNQDSGVTSASEPTVKSGTPVFPPQHVWNPSTTYGEENRYDHSSMPAATILWSVPEFYSSLTEDAGSGPGSMDPSEAEVFNRMWD